MMRPWYIVPADDKQNARLIVSRIVLDTLEALRLSYPKSSAARRRELRFAAQAARGIGLPEPAVLEHLGLARADHNEHHARDHGGRPADPGRNRVLLAKPLLPPPRS